MKIQIALKTQRQFFTTQQRSNSQLVCKNIHEKVIRSTTNFLINN